MDWLFIAMVFAFGCFCGSVALAAAIAICGVGSRGEA